MRARSCLEIAGLAEGVELDAHTPTMDDWQTFLRVGEPVDVVLATVPEGDSIRHIRSLVRRAGSAPVCVISATDSPSIRLEARRAGAEWIPTDGPDHDYREIWRRLRGAIAYSESRPELERRTLSAILVALEEMRIAIASSPIGHDELEHAPRGWRRAVGMLDAWGVKILLWILAVLVAIVGTAVGVDVGLPMLAGDDVGGEVSP